jgi:hypothetical protein
MLPFAQNLAEGYTQDGKEGYAEVQELLEQGGDLYNNEFVNVKALSSDIGATLSRFLHSISSV